jgi:hypothetical protein
MERGTGAGGWRASKRGPGGIVRESELKLNLDIEEMEKGRVAGVRPNIRKSGTTLILRGVMLTSKGWQTKHPNTIKLEDSVNRARGEETVYKDKWVKKEAPPSPRRPNEKRSRPTNNEEGKKEETDEENMMQKRGRSSLKIL